MNAPRRLLLPPLIALLALVVVGALAILAAPRVLTAIRYGGIDVREAPATCPGQATSTLGVPAISPHNDCTPSFSAQDVIDYENTHPFATRRTEPVGKPKITKIWFVTSAEASGQMAGESTGLSDAALVCYVEFYGTFRTGLAPGGEPTERTGAASQVFDAHTGNLLVAGG
jgi:hypothetical protein